MKPFNPIQQVKRQCPAYDRFATGRSLALLVSGYKSLLMRYAKSCSRCRETKAAIDGAAVVTPFNPVQQVKRQCPAYDRFATGRSLALLVSGYGCLLM
ncbi:hypothetical protein, partial [Pseudomonas sp. TMW22091]|uniref:hypothetical protein n=1 Tax=Pseudomonas sp. TMW22091 TaxID=2506435 RepID=UPI001F0F2690